MNEISSGIVIIFTSIQSNMDMRVQRKNGRFHRSIGLLNGAFIPWIGVDASATMKTISANVKKEKKTMGFASLYPSYESGLEDCRVG
jgi:hypothetical protein